MIPNQAEKYAFLFRLLIALIVVIIIAGVSFANYLIKEQKELGNRIYPNVYIDNIQVGGKTKEDATSALQRKYAILSKVTISVLFKETPIATLSAKTLGIKLNVTDTVNNAYLIGRASKLSDRVKQKITSLLNWGRFDYYTRVIYNKKSIADFVKQTEQNYNVPAKNALFEFENNRVTSFRPEEDGTQIKSEEFVNELEKRIVSLKDMPKSHVIEIRETVLKPDITLAKANQFGIEELIGEGQSDYSGSISERIHNILVASSRFHGVLIPKGEEFSFNQIVGDISATTGYKQAYIIQNGKTVLGDGGGVCQVSTTIFRAALKTGLPITQRVAHAYRVGYYENDSKPGFDATVFNPTVDLRFKNDTPAAILIQTEIDKTNRILRFKFYGKKDARIAQISSPTLWDVQPPPPPSYQDDPTLKKGVTKQVDFAAWGGKSNFSYKVTRNGQEIFSKNFYSAYRPWQAVFLVGISD